MLDSLRDKTIVIIGGSSGIGRATGILFGSLGANVVIAARNVELGEEACHSIEKAGGQASFSRLT